MYMRRRFLRPNQVAFLELPVAAFLAVVSLVDLRWGPSEIGVRRPGLPGVKCYRVGLLPA